MTSTVAWFLLCATVCSAQLQQPQQHHAHIQAAAVKSFLAVGQSETPKDGSECKKVLWFTAIGARFGRKSTTERYLDMLKVAVLSAQENAPSLVPHLIYDGEEGPFTEWYRQHGGTVHFWNLTFLPQLKQSIQRKEHDRGWLTQYGAFMRIDIPLILAGRQSVNSSVSDDDDSDSTPAATRRLSRLHSSPFFGPNITKPWVLYTDSDVMFVRDVTSCDIPWPRVVAMGPEFDHNTIANSGVMVVNVLRLGRQHDAIIKHGVRTHWHGILDQTLLLEFFGPRLARLQDALNWKPYWGPSQDARIIHFHGLKPGRCLSCLLKSPSADSCGCSPVYVWIWKAHLNDGGKFYRLCLQQYEQYLTRATHKTQTPVVSVSRHRLSHLRA